MAWKEIAANLGISEGRVRQLYKRAMEKIRNMVEKEPELRDVLADYSTTYKRPTKRLLKGD